MKVHASLLCHGTSFAMKTFAFHCWMITEDQTKAYPALAAMVFPCGGGKVVPYQKAGAQGLPKPQAVDLDRLCCYQVA